MTSVSACSKNLPLLFLHQVDRFKARDALLTKDLVTKQFKPITWGAWADSVFRVSSALSAYGIATGDKVAIMSENGPAWTYVDLGALALGAVVVPLYPTLALAEVIYVLKHSEAKILFVTKPELAQALQVYLAEKDSALKKIVLLGTYQQLSENADIDHWNDFIACSKALGAAEKEFRENSEEIAADSVATIIYTSGTTGPQKGVMLTHQNFLENARMAQSFVSLGEADLALSFLPLSHVFERLAGYYFMIQAGATIAYAESISTVAEDIKLVKPTVAAAVPRFYEKVHAKIMEQVRSKSGFVQKLFSWALIAGKEYREARRYGRLNGWLRIRFFIADKIALGKIKQAMGGRIRFFISGGAPLSQELAEFFYSAGVLILEGYGLTETSPVIAVNSESDYRFGTVGKPLPGVEVKISDDGEILTKSLCVMKGYYRNPEATAEVIKNGWFYTGDIGLIDNDGYLKITDRKKDIIVTSGGKNIAPQNIEGELMQDSLIHQAVLVGDKRNYVVALIVPSKEEVLKRAAEEKINYETWEELLKSPKVKSWVAEAIDARMSSKATFEQIKYFALLDRELTVESGELTPTMKVKRRLVMENYAGIIEELYRQGSLSQAAKS